MRTFLLVTLACALLPASLAPAATLTFEAPPPCADEDSGCRTGTVVFRGEPGERNELTVVQEAGTLVFREAAVPIAAPASCTRRSEREVACPAAAGRAAVTVDTGDADDVVDATATAGGVLLLGGAGGDRLSGGTRITGGPGDDALSGARQLASILDGGDGADRITAGPRGATLDGGAGDDVLTGDRGPDSLDGGAGSDALDGGAGRDRASYAGRTDPVVVELPDGAGGAAGENDTLRQIEDVTGGDGDDRLRGDAAGNVLDGGDGDDSVLGGGGNDSLTGGGGTDELRGDDGDDAIDAASGIRRAADSRLEPVACGAGRDTVVVRRDLVGRDCEGIDAGASTPVAVPHPVQRGRRLVFRIRCPSELRRRGRCTGGLTLTQRGKTVASGRISVAARGGRVTARFDRPPRGRLGVRLTLRGGGTAEWSVTLGSA